MKKTHFVSTDSAGRRCIPDYPDRWNYGRQGFTLIELLVVIAIISLLVSILMPSLQMARELTKTVVCQGKMRNWGLAMEVYQGDFNQEYAPVMDRRVSPYMYWFDFLASYADCEDGANPGYFRGRGDFDRKWMNRCPVISEYSPSENSTMKFDSDYLYNASLAPRYNRNGGLFFDIYARSSDRVFDLARTLILVDGRANFEDTILQPGKTDMLSINTKVDYRHNETYQANVLFGDGHVETLEANFEGNRYLPIAWSTIEGMKLLWRQH